MSVSNGEYGHSEQKVKNLSLDIKWARVPSMKNPWRVSNITLFTLMLVSSLVFVLVASYVLWCHRKDPRSIASFQAPRPVLVADRREEAVAAAHFSLQGNGTEMHRLVQTIVSKLEYPPRRVPEEKEARELDSRLFSGIHEFLPSTKSPCFYEEWSGPSRDNRPDFSNLTFYQDGKQFYLRCLPYFYLIGQPKCGTTDLFFRLCQHPQIRYNVVKEPQWWTRRRFGPEKNSMEDYLDIFFRAVGHIQEGFRGDLSALNIITGDASASTMWDNQQFWSYYYHDREDAEPDILTLDLIHAANPAAKILVILRDPVERLYSEYLFFGSNKSLEDFHQKVEESLRLFGSCLSQRSLHYCVFNTNLTTAVPLRIHVGMYVVFLQDWLGVFGREQVHVVRLEEYSADLKTGLEKVFDFLDVDPLSPEFEENALRAEARNPRRGSDRALGPMFPATREILQEFYRPFNHKLAGVLENEAFLWTYP